MQRSNQQQAEDLIRQVSGMNKEPVSHPLLRQFVTAIQTELTIPADGILGPKTADSIVRLDEKQLNELWFNTQAKQTSQVSTKKSAKKKQTSKAASQDYLSVPEFFTKLMEEKGFSLIEDNKVPLGNSIKGTKASQYSVQIHFNQEDLGYWLKGKKQLNHENRSTLLSQIKPHGLSVPIYVSTSSQLFDGDDEFRQFCDSQTMLAIRIISGPTEGEIYLQFVVPGKTSSSIQGKGAVAGFYRNILEMMPEAVLNNEDLELVNEYLELGNTSASAEVSQQPQVSIKQATNEDELSEEAQEGIRLTGYVSDDIHRADQLGIHTEVKALCGIIAARDVEPPLSIGLFGDWGTGKSFFIKEMIQCLQAMALKSQEVEDKFAQDPDSIEPDYWSNIAQITFNAWHYEDADLWASLVVRIFDALAEHVTHGLSDPDKINLERQKVFAQTQILKNELATYQQKLANTLQEQSLAEAALLEAEIDLLSAEKNLNQFSIENIKNTLLEEFTREKPQLATLAKEVGLGQVASTAEEFDQQLDSLKSDVRMTHSNVLTLKQKASSPMGIAVLLALLLFGFVTSMLVRQLDIFKDSPDWKDTISQITALMTWLLGILATLRTWLAPLKQKTTELLRLYDDYEQRVKARSVAQETQVEDARKHLQQTKQKQASEQQVLQNIQAKISALNTEIELIKSGRLLRKFLEKKQNSNLYRGKLGIVSSIREDFNLLSEILGIQSSQKRSRWSSGERHGPENIGTSDGNFADVDRIVLYIDDLDRCAPERVVEILRAVHLLLAFKLFVVVVAVDSRWLLNSLKLSMRNLAGNENQQAVKLLLKDNVQEGSLNNNLISTPQNYLEKIFQIPYTIPAMTQAGVGRLLQQLSEPLDGADEMLDSVRIADVQTDSIGSTENANLPTERVNIPENAAQLENEVTDSETSVTPLESHVSPDDHPQSLKNTDTTPVKADNSATNSVYQIQANSSRSHIRDYELASMAKCWRGFTTPRAINRFVNTYRLMRSMVEVQDQDRFYAEQNGEYQTVILLLTILIAFPNDAGRLFKLLKNGDPDSKFKNLLVDDDKSQSKGTPLSKEKLSQLFTEFTYVETAIYRPFQYWLPLVMRFSFRPFSL